MDTKCIIDPSRDCLGLAKADMLEKQMDQFRTQARETHKEIFGRLNKLEQSDSARETQYETISEKLDELLDYKKEQQEKPGKDWAEIKSKVFVAVLSTLITACVTALATLAVKGGL